MNRRDFLKALAAIPGLALLKPGDIEPVEILDEPIETQELVLVEDAIEKINGVPVYLMKKALACDPDGISYTGGRFIAWNENGDTWESSDRGKTWTQTRYAPTVWSDESPEGTAFVLQMGEDGSLSVKGQLVRFNGQTWEPL